MASNLIPSPEGLRQLLRYEPDTGRLFWKERPVEMFEEGKGRYTAKRAQRIFNSQFAGKEAFAVANASLGYRQGSIWCRKYYAHRVIWAMQTGSWPKGEIDHQNGNRGDNRWANLRLVSRLENTRNAQLRSNNNSGVVGVSWHVATSKWRARICVGGRTICLGCYETLEEACAARIAAERRYGFHKNHGRPAS